MARASEPEALRRGKAFHRMIQDEWEREAEGSVTREKPVRKPTGRRGRVDVFVDDEDSKGVIAIVEIKASDWDRMTTAGVRRNVRRQIRQIWSYIESQIVKGEYTSDGEGKSVCPGVIFPRRPRDPERTKRIEDMFIEEGIPVVWHDDDEGQTKESRP